MAEWRPLSLGRAAQSSLGRFKYSLKTKTVRVASDVGNVQEVGGKRGDEKGADEKTHYRKSDRNRCQLDQATVRRVR